MRHQNTENDSNDTAAEDGGTSISLPLPTREAELFRHTLQGYLLAMTGIDPTELRDHESPYDFAKGRVPF